MITGEARYTDDIKLPGVLHMAVVRSPYAHANIVSIDSSAAEAMDGVVAVYTSEDIGDGLAGLPTAWLIPDSDLKTPEHPALAKGKVRYVGDGVAIVLADDRYRAQDAADAVVVDYEELPAVIDPEEAAGEGAPLIHDDVEGNIAFRWVMGDREASDAVFDAADVVVSERILQQRLLPDGDGNTRGDGAVQPGDARVDALVHLAESAYSPLHHQRGDRLEREQSAGHRAGSRWRLRQQDPLLSRMRR